MNKKEKKAFINMIIKNIRGDIIKQVDKMPDSWDGKELRLYISERFSRIVWSSFSKGLKRKFKNDVLINGL